jgi:nitronate monooxygenase
VGQGAGGHAGPLSLQVLVPALRREFPHVQVAAAGGVATGAGLLSTLALGADAASVGTLFIASTEATVAPEYKQAILDYGMEDIVLTDRISGTPCNVINTPYVQQSGTQQNWFERWLNRNRRTKKWFKTLVQIRGMKALEKAAFSATYKTMWCAGQTVELIDEIRPISVIVDRLAAEYAEAYSALPTLQPSSK